MLMFVGISSVLLSMNEENKKKKKIKLFIPIPVGVSFSFDDDEEKKGKVGLSYFYFINKYISSRLYDFPSFPLLDFFFFFVLLFIMKWERKKNLSHLCPKIN